MCATNYIRYILKCKREKINIYNMGCNQSNEYEGPNPYPPPSTSSYEVEEIRYQITFLPNHEIIGEFGQKIITNPLNNSSSSSSSSSDMYKKEMKHNVYIKSIHPSVLTYCVDDHGMKVGDVIEKIRTDGPDGIEQDVIELDKTTNSLLTDERPITLTCSGKRYNDAMSVSYTHLTLPTTPYV